MLDQSPLHEKQGDQSARPVLLLLQSFDRNAPGGQKLVGQLEEKALQHVFEQNLDVDLLGFSLGFAS